MTVISEVRVTQGHLSHTELTGKNKNGLDIHSNTR